MLHLFDDNGKDGYNLYGTPALDKAGNVYGTTSMGGANCKTGCGIVFQLSPGKNGKWKEKILHSFQLNGKDGVVPYAGVILDAADNVYGTTGGGGAGTGAAGTVFELTLGKTGKWREKILHTFKNTGNDGNRPQAGLTFDAAGNLYGTTLVGGTGSGHACKGCGTVFRLTPGTNGKWKEKVLYSFNNNGTDGIVPYGGVVLDSSGNLYGATEYGGASGSNCSYACGVVFEVTP